MKVSIITRYFNYDNAGIGVTSTEFLRELLNRSWNLDLHCTSFRGAIGYFFYTAFILNYELKAGGEDVDVFHALTPMETIWTPEEKTLVMFHDLIPWLHKDIKTWYFKGFLKSLRRRFGGLYFELAAKRASRSKRIHCNSEETKREVMENLKVPEDKITVTRIGIGEHLRPIKKNHDGYRVGTLTYLDPRKRIGVLIKAFKSANINNSKLLIGGKGGSNELRRLREIAGNDKRVIFKGFVPESEKAEFLSSLDVFVMPSILEGYGIPCVEAMACKTPVVTLKDSLIPEDVKGKTHSVATEELSKLLEERSFNCDIDLNFDFAKGHSWSSFADKVIELYGEIYDSQ